MRAGAFAEPRVIELLNRRFVPFYFNTGGPGLGRDEAAEAFVKGKVKNKWAHFAAFKPDGTYLEESEIYADKDGAFEFLLALLRDNPGFNTMTPEEEKAVAGEPVVAARIHEALGDYEKAAAAWEKAGAKREARLGLARIARFRKDWEAQEKAVKGLEVDADVVMENGYRRIAQKKYAGALESLEAAIAKYPESPRLAEMRFYAGVSCWFLEKRDRANFHWCWVVENLPDDHLARRCYIAAAAEGMPYANPELDGYALDSQMGSIEVIKEAYQEALKDYRKVREQK
ncbi:MAG: hypothetical protein FD180_3351 [Planctomycetota bacterium]|nr:MAG: hypothetical protein FD180_3351 [Planctomycetota bacterium]